MAIQAIHRTRLVFNLPGFLIIEPILSRIYKQALLSVFRRYLGVSLSVGLIGCAGAPQSNVGVLGRIWQQLAQADISTITLNPGYQYKRVWLNGRQALITLSYVEPQKNGKNQTVWYSPDGYVFRFIDGRLTGLAYKERAWYGRYTYTPEVWAQTVSSSPAPAYSRRTDEVPGNIFGTEFRLQLQPLQSPPRGHRMMGLAEKFTWFEERTMGREDVSVMSSLAEHGGAGPAWYAVSYRTSPAKVIFGQQCLRSDLCLSWQDWPVTALD